MTLTVDINMWFKVTTGTLVLKIGSVKGTGFQRGLIGPPPWLRNFAQDHCILFTIKHSMGKVWARLGQKGESCSIIFYGLYNAILVEMVLTVISPKTIPKQSNEE